MLSEFHLKLMENKTTQYDPINIEKKQYQFWLDNKLFKSPPDHREAYTNVIPPPNVTGVLHIGHMLNNTIQDVLIRRARMLGKNACWVPGTDHASIATEAKVVNKLAEQGIKKSDLTREEFLKHAWEWKEKHGGIILEQLKKLGASCDWDRTCFTMDDALYESVIDTFIDLYKKDKIYRGTRMVNWDPLAKTAVSDEEVEYKEERSKLYYVKYKIAGTENQFVTIATTRPETILGDTAVCVNPNDERFLNLKGKKVIVPIVEREVPIIFDEYVDMEFGTGCLKITPAHDINDYEIGLRHNLELIDIFNTDGTLSTAAKHFVGIDRFEARKLVNKELEKQGLITKIEDYTNKVGYSQRTNVVIEPKLSQQWFLKMSELAKPALENVLNDTIRFFPTKFKNIYKHWMENIKDWCISRQLWWGQRIPAYFIDGGKDFVVAKNIEEALKLAKEKTGNNSLKISDLKQDEDVLDTWFSSWLWPISVFDGIRYPDNEEINYYYPTSILVTGHDIIFFWVARMIITGYEYRANYPFKDVYFTGMVRDGQGRKMSKQLGNSPDPINLIDQYGADGVRVGMLLCAPAGGDLLFEVVTDAKTGENSYPLVEQGRNFGNKIWNAFRLIKMWEVDTDALQPESSKIAIHWFKQIINQAIEKLDLQFDTYRISESLMTVYKLFWDDFSSWYLEMVKPAYQQPIDAQTYNATINILDTLLRMLHPFMPFITEEIWQLLEKRTTGDSIMIAQLPKFSEYSKTEVVEFEHVKSLITNIRKIRVEKNIPQKDALILNVQAGGSALSTKYQAVVAKLANLSELVEVTSKADNVASFMIDTDEYSIPLGEMMNLEEEIAKLEKELQYNIGFYQSVEKKLTNERFVNSAPQAVVEKEKQKLEDAQSKISSIEEQLKNLKSNI